MYIPVYQHQFWLTNVKILYTHYFTHCQYIFDRLLAQKIFSAHKPFIPVCREAITKFLVGLIQYINYHYWLSRITDSTCSVTLNSWHPCTQLPDQGLKLTPLFSKAGTTKRLSKFTTYPSNSYVHKPLLNFFCWTGFRYNPILGHYQLHNVKVFSVITKPPQVWSSVITKPLSHCEFGHYTTIL